MKRISAIILAVCLMFICGTSAIAASPPDTEVEAKPLLSEMDEDQCMEILSDLGVTIPAELKDVDIQGIVEELESDPNMPAPILSYTPMVELFKDIRTAVTKYHEVAASSAQYTLQNSTLYS